MGWNREHLFARSLFIDQTPAVNDNHHIFADDNKTNGHRGNKPFNELNPATTTRSIDSYGNVMDNYYTSTYFMPNKLAKGEVARATMYMNTRYDYSVTLNFYSVELMLEWHLENPVTNRGIYRNNTVYGSASITVTNHSVFVTGVSISPTSLNLDVGSSASLIASVMSANATNKSVTWASSHPSIASVNNSGQVSGLTVGSGTITVTTSEGGYTDTIPFTVTALSVPLEPTTFSFDPSGNTDWTNISGFAKYFTNSYGISSASAGGTLNSTNILENMPLGSIFTVNVATATNNASSYATLTIYGLSKDGSRIPNILSYYQTAYLSTSTDTILRNHALSNPGVLTLPASLTTKVYALELVTDSASSKTLLAEISVSYVYNTASNQALAFANFVNGEGGQGAFSKCDVILSNLVTEYNRLSIEGRNYFEG